MGRRTDIDWESVERDYRLGQLSLRQLEAKHGVGFAAIQKRAKAKGWKQDLSDQVRAETKALLQEQAVKTIATEQLQKDNRGVTAVAELNRAVINEHREDIAACKALVRSLMVEVAETAQISRVDTDLIVALTDMRDDKDNPLVGTQEAVRLLQRLREATGMPARVSASKALAEALSKLIALERQAYGLDDEGSKNEETWEQLLARIKE